MSGPSFSRTAFGFGNALEALGVRDGMFVVQYLVFEVILSKRFNMGKLSHNFKQDTDRSSKWGKKFLIKKSHEFGHYQNSYFKTVLSYRQQVLQLLLF